MHGEAIYDLDTLARWNMHIHSTYSKCAKPGMTIGGIVHEAERCGLRQIAVTDHFNSAGCPILEQIAAMRGELAGSGQGNGPVEILFGAELSAYGVGKWLDSDEVSRSLDYRLYSYNHFHLDYWEHPEDRSPRGYVNHSLEVLRTLLRSERADSIAHPFIGRFIRCFEDRTLVTKAITDKELGDIMELGARCGCAWELNLNSIVADPAFGRRFWNMGKEVGAVFHLATDAHRPEQIDPHTMLEEIKGIIGE